MRGPIRNELTRNSSGNILPQSSQLAEPLWTDPGVKRGISVPKLISKHTHTHKLRRGVNIRTFSTTKNPPPPYASTGLSNHPSTNLPDIHFVSILRLDGRFAFIRVQHLGDGQGRWSRHDAGCENVVDGRLKHRPTHAPSRT